MRRKNTTGSTEDKKTTQGPQVPTKLKNNIEETRRQLDRDVKAGDPKAKEFARFFGGELKAVRELRRREHLVVREVRDARQHVRVSAAQGKAGLLVHNVASSVKATNSLTVIGG